MDSRYARMALKIAAIYALMGSAWILFSDRAVKLLNSDPDAIIAVSIAKGWLYVLFTAIILYLLLRRYLAEISRAEDRLRTSEEKFSRSFNYSPALMSISDIDSGTYIEVNEKFCRVSGFSRSEIIGRTSVELGWITSADREQLVTLLRRDGRVVNTELALTDREGGKVFCLFSAEIVAIEGVNRLLSIALDISDRKTTEQALRESEERYRRFSSMTTDYVASCRRSGSDPYRIKWMGGAVEEITGFSQEEIIRWGCWLPIVHPEDAPRIGRSLQEMKAGERRSDEFRIIRKDGAVRWIHENSCCEAGDSPGELLRFGTSQDITGRKETETAIMSLNENLERLVKERTSALERSNEDLAGFSYAVSHELRAPIARLQGFCDVIEETCDGKEELLSLADRIKNSSRQLQSVVDSLLSLSRLSIVERFPEEVNLSEMAGKAAEQLLTGHRDWPVELVITPGIMAVADPSLMQICLDNLIGNALKYTSQKDKARIEFGSYNDSGRDVYFVRDNGAGFDMAYAGNLYAPFQRLHQHKEFPGFGIGLATVKRIIEKHGGEIWAESRVGEGATFFFTLGGQG